MARLKNAIGIVLLVLAAVAHGQTKTPGDLLQEGLYAEQTEGDLDKAIGIYTEVLEQAGEIQRLAAQAAYQLGMCYLKKDDTGKAAEYFRQVATKYTDEKSLARRAANKLKRLVPAASAVGSSTPHVVSTTPAALSNDVNPDLDRITVTFNMPMMDQSWSWTGGGDTYPQTTGRPYYDATRTTCTMPVKLEPGKVYWVGINSPSHKNFKTPDRDPAPWTIILFATRGTDGSPTPIPQDQFDRAKSINQRARIQAQNTTQMLLKDNFEKGSDTPEGWSKGNPVDGVEYIWDRNNIRGGTASLCLKKTVNKYFPIAQWTKRIEYQTDAQQLSVKAQIKAQNVTKAILDALFLDENNKWIKHEWISYIGQKTEENIPPANHDWKQYTGTVEIPESTKTIVIGLQIYGPGTVWLDNLEVAARQSKSHIADVSSTAEKAATIQEALEATESWLKLVDAGKYSGSWDEGAEYFKEAMPKEKWNAALEIARKPLGNLISREVLSKSYTPQIPGAPDGEYVMITFKAFYENKKMTLETVTPMLDKDGKWRVAGYYIQIKE